jgi:MerR family transcriptional regulator, light-induced transcriptional regulator
MALPPRSDASASGRDLNLKQAAARLGVHYMTVYRYVRQGQLVATQVGTVWRVSESDLNAFAAQRSRRVPAHCPLAEPTTVDWDVRLVPCLLGGDEPAAWRVVEAALASGHPVTFCYVNMLSGALASIGARWDAGEVSIAEQHIATAVAARLVARLGALARRPGRSRGTVIFGAPTGELHSLPIAIAADLVRMAGFTVLELGANVPAEAFAGASQRAPRLIAIGIGVTASERLFAAQDTIDAIRRVDPVVPIIIGGQAAFTTASAGLTGVTAWAANGPEAVNLIESLAHPRRSRRRSGHPTLIA